jgi:phosphoserine phosphatase
MVALFADLPEAAASTVEIAQRCAFRPRIHQPILPRFSVGDNGSAPDEASELRKRAEEGLERRLETAGVAPGHTVDEYRERLDFELDMIALARKLQSRGHEIVFIGVPDAGPTVCAAGLNFVRRNFPIDGSKATLSK